jgi:hypothetical protein
MGRSAVCDRLDFVPPATPRGFLPLLRRHPRNPVLVFRSRILLCLDLCHLLLLGRLAGKLEVPTMRAGIFPGCVLSQSFWRPMFPLQPSQVVCFRDRRNYFPTQVSLSLGSSRATQSLINVARANGKSRDAGSSSSFSSYFSFYSYFSFCSYSASCDGSCGFSSLGVLNGTASKP